AQMMMVRDHHAVAQPAIAQSGLEISHALVAILGIILAGANGRRSLSPTRLVLPHTQKRNLRPAVDHGRHTASRGILRQFNAIAHPVPSDSCGDGSLTRPAERSSAVIV